MQVKHSSFSTSSSSQTKLDNFHSVQNCTNQLIAWSYTSARSCSLFIEFHLHIACSSSLSSDNLSSDGLSLDSLSLELYKAWKLSSSVWLELLVDWDFSYVYGKNVQKKIFQLAKWKSSTKHLTNSHVSENLNLELFEQISAKKTWFQQSEPLFY